MAELTGDLRAELLCIAGELGGKMETFTCYNANKSWKRIEIVYDEKVQDGNWLKGSIRHEEPIESR